MEASEVRRLIDSATELRSSNPHEAASHLRQAIALAQEQRMWPLEAEAQELLCHTLGKTGSVDFSVRARELGKALVLYRELSDEAGQARILTRLGNIANNTADYAVAFDYLHEAEDICTRLGDASLSEEVLGQLSGVHMELGDFTTALTYAKRTLELLPNIDDPVRALLAINGLGCVMGLMGEHEQGVAKIREAHGYIDRIPDERRRKHYEAQSYADLSEAFLNWGKPDEALANAEEGARAASECDFRPLVQLSRRYAGRAALALGNPMLALEWLQPALELARQTGQKSQESRTQFELSEALATLGRHQEALNSYKDGHRIEREFRRDLAACRVEFRRVKQDIDNARHEQESAERILFTVLPEAIARRMRGGEARIADKIADVSILFADLVGFTAMSRKTEPAELLERLEKVFSKFDQLTSSARLEKIKTIGDAYMVVGGALDPAKDHLEQCAYLAIEMMRAMDQLREDSGVDLSIRIGLHVGPAIAGVIGTTRLSYDLWGETVNFASRMESSGVPGRIQVSASVAERLKRAFHLEPRGSVELKGFGAVQTYFLGCAH